MFIALSKCTHYQDGDKVQMTGQMNPENVQNQKEGPMVDIHPQPTGLLLPAIVTQQSKIEADLKAIQ